MQMQDETGQILQNGTVIGPLIEGQRFISYCEARGGRPRPNVGWYLHGKRLAGVFQNMFSLIQTKFSLTKKIVLEKLVLSCFDLKSNILSILREKYNFRDNISMFWEILSIQNRMKSANGTNQFNL